MSGRKIMGFSDLNKDDAQNDDKNDQRWFTGGASSGMQVEAPKKNLEIAEDVFKTASGHSSKPVAAPTFGGSGFRLGQDGNINTQPVEQNPVPKTFIIKLYANGFNLNDGPLRSYQDPANQEFLDSVKQGLVPRELEKYGGPGSQFHVDLHDLRSQDFVPAKQKMTPFGGSGMRLGDEDASTTTTTPAAVPQTSSTSELKVDPDQPTTKVQIRFLDGSKETVKFNHTHTVGDLRAYVNSSKPSDRAYVLATPMPPKVLADDSQSLKEAGLLNAVVIQRPN